MKRLVIAANWKMHLGPAGAREFMEAFLGQYRPADDREVWFFPPAVSLATVASLAGETPGLNVGAQNVFWEPEGAFTGELSAAMAREAGARGALVGHSERRHMFGESDEDVAKKLGAVIEHGLTAMLCVGERLEQREAGETLKVVERQLGVLAGLRVDQLGRVLVAYEPVWAIGTGRTATPQDAAEIHAFIRMWMVARGLKASAIRVLYGGSVKPGNIGALVSEVEIDGVLVGGASLNPDAWADMVRVPLD
jgi:triosephosphate isomerase